MRAITKPFSFRFRSNPRERSSVQDRQPLGFALIVMMIAVTILTIGLLMVLPSIAQEARREHEEELLFRGNQYARAIYLFQQRYNRYPNSVKELIHTDNLSFLRKAWPDPMTPGGKWRFIHVSGQGALIDSWTMGPQMNNGQSNTNALGSFSNSSASNSGGFGGQSGFGGSSGFGSSGGFGGSSGFGGSTAGMGGGSQGGFDWPSGGSSGFAGGSTASSGFGSGFGSSGDSGFGSSSSTSSFGSSSTSTGGSSTPGTGNPSTGAVSSSAPGRPRDENGKPKQSPDCQGTGVKPLNPESLYSAGSSESMSGFALNNGTQGLALAGVASCSDQKSLRTWNKHKVYSEWEFLGVGFSAGGAGGPVQASAPTSGLPGMTGVQGQGTSQSGFGSSSGFGQQGNSGFGQQGNTGFGQSNGGFGGSTGFGNQQGSQQGNQNLYPPGQPAEPPTTDNPPNNPPDSGGTDQQPPPDSGQPPL